MATSRARLARAAVLSGFLVTLAGAPPAAGARCISDPAVQPPTEAVDLAAGLADDGTFVGQPGLRGTVDASAWTLTSDLALDEAPRFEPAGGRSNSSSIIAAAPSWSALGSNPAGTDGALNTVVEHDPLVLALAVSGANLYVGGNFTDAAGIATADYVARWDGSAWSALGSNGAGTDGALNGGPYDLAVVGSDLFVGGTFTNAAGIAQADYVARWNGSAWSALGSNGAGTDGALNRYVYALSNSGANLFVGGEFTDAAGIVTADRVARWNGSSWSALGSNPAGTDGALNQTNSWVAALIASSDGVYVGGGFSDAAGIPQADSVARWNGSAWSALGSNGAGTDGALNNPVDSFALSGSDLYVGGRFWDAAGIATADRVARWNGSSWSALGSNPAGTDGAISSGYVLALVVSGGDLYAGGDFLDAAGIATADGIARWNGSSWSPLGSNPAGTDGALDAGAWALAMSTSSLYVGGGFADVAGLATADRVAAFGQIFDRPDGRIRKGSGAFVGNDIYNTDGTNQRKEGAKSRGSTITFGISIQNDGTFADRFSIHANGAVSTMYTVKYLRGTTDITAAVVAGTYSTPSLAPGTTYLITAKVKVNQSATKGSSTTRLVTITSVGDGTAKDAVAFTGKRL